MRFRLLRSLPAASAALVLAGLVPAAGCQLLAGLGGEEPLGAGGGGSGGAPSGGAGGTGAGSTSAGGDGGGGGSTACMQGETVACYGGPAGTEGVGTCKGGTRTCGSDGTFGPCEGEVQPAVEKCDTADDEDCNGFNCGDVRWAKQLTGVNSANVAFDPTTGELVTTGSFSGSITLGATTLTSKGNRDGLVARWSPDGDLVWARSFGDASNQSLSTLTVDAAGNTYINFSNSGTLEADRFTTTSASGLLKLDKAGNVAWLTETGGQGGVIVLAGFSRLAMATDGALLGHARFLNTMQIGTTVYTKNEQDGIVAKFDAATGMPEWSFQYGTTVSDGGGHIAPAPAGGVYLTGTVDGFVNFPGGQVVSGTSATDTDAFVARIGADGQFVWGKAFGTPPDYQAGRALAADTAGNVFVGGFFAGSFAISGGGSTLTSNGDFDMFMAGFDQVGSHVWSATYGDVGPVGGGTGPSAMAIGPDGGLVVGGELTGTMQFGDSTLSVDGSADGYVAKVSSANGETIWARKIGGASYQLVHWVAVGSDNRIAIGGEFEGAVSLGKDSFVTAGGDPDPFIAVLEP